MNKTDAGAINEEQAGAALERRLGRSLPPQLKRRIMERPWLGHHLVVVSEDPDLLDRLINRLSGEAEGASGDTPSHSRPSISAKQALQAVGAVAGATLWKSKRASAERIQQRLSACKECPNLKHGTQSDDAKSRKRSDKFSICAFCGCFVELKARILAENCPSPSPNDPGRSRWGENID